MLEELIVLNGELSPKYDKYNNEYTVKVDNSVNKLELSFVKEETVEVSVYGNNNLKEGENNIVLLITKDGETDYIYLNAIKESSEEVFQVFDTTNSLEVANSAPIYAGPLIATSCFLLIITLFAFLFGFKRKQ